MNPKDLADELEKAPYLWFKDDIAGRWVIKALRQQESEIKLLRQAMEDAFDGLETMTTFAKSRKGK